MLRKEQVGIGARPGSVVVLGLEMSSRTNFESLALKVKPLALRAKSLVNSPRHLRAT